MGNPFDDDEEDEEEAPEDLDFGDRTIRQLESIIANGGQNARLRAVHELATRLKKRRGMQQS